MRQIRLANKIIATLIKDKIKYPDRLIVDTFIMIARCGVLLILYAYVFKLKGGEINGLIFPIAAWSIFFYFAFSSLRLRDISRLIMQDVQTGNVELLFCKPVAYLSYRMWWQIGLGIYSFLVITVLGALALILFVGLPSTMINFLFLPTLALTFIGALAISLVLYSIIGVLAFWIEDINPVFWMVDKAVMILGGSYLPVALFPDFVQKLALYSPFGASLFITHTVYATWQTDWYKLIGWQIFWFFILSLFLYFLFIKARKRISVNGG